MDAAALFRAQRAGTVLIALALWAALPASAVDVLLTSGTTGTTFINQSFNGETRGARVTILGSGNFVVTSMKVAAVDVTGGTIGARIYNNATQALVASANTTASGNDLIVTIPISASLPSGTSYRIAFYNAGGSADLYDPTPAGLSVTPYNDATGSVQVVQTYQGVGDVFPVNQNGGLPYITVTGTFQVAPPPTAAYSITGGGAQLVIGDAPMPVQATFPATGTMFPPLLIAPNPDPAKRLIKQTTGADPKRMTLPPGVFLRKAPGPGFVGVAQQNGRMFQVRTNAAFSAPANVLGSAILKAGGRTGAAITTLMGSGSNIIRYAKLAAQFGGPAQIKVVPATPIRVWARDKAAVPCKHPSFGGADTNCIAYLLPAYPGALAAPGAKVGFATMTVGGPPVSNNVVAVSVPKATGLVAKSAVVGKVVLTNVASSSGFPWTTGKVTISAPSAFGIPERFTLTGMDSRVNGVGTISLVSGALSKRTITAANANRGWLRLTVPEPGALVGAAAALGTLAACHFLMRRRARRAGD